jgi:hypothetical protein
MPLKRYAAIAAAAACLAACAFEVVAPPVEAPPDGPLAIAELQTANDSYIDYQGDTPDWFELANGSAAPVDLAAYSVSDELGKPRKWKFPAESLAAGARLVIFASGKDQSDPAYQLHTNFSLAPGEDLYLFRDGRLVDHVAVPKGDFPAGSAWNRGADGALVLTNRPSPGAEPVQGLNPPAASPPAGLYRSADYPQGLTVALSGAGTIRYTVDGSVPTESSPVYDPLAPIVVPFPSANPAAGYPSLPSGLVLRAASWDGAERSEILTASYLVDAGAGLAVFSLSAAPGVFHDPTTGLFAAGQLYSGLEASIHVEYFDAAGAPRLAQDAGATLYGAYSRTLPMKSIALRARSAYGTGRFKYDFFGLRNERGGPIESFDDLVLRNHGNDFNQGNIRDAFFTSLLAGTGQDYMAYRPVAVFLDGVYWGFYSLREKLNESYLADHRPAAGSPGYDIVANFGELNAPSAQGFFDLLHWLDPPLYGLPGTAPDLAVQANYDRVDAELDIANFIDYQIFNIFIGNTDWPRNNTKCWRPRVAGGKWRWLVYDTDFGFGGADNLPPDFNTLQYALNTDPGAWRNSPESTLLLRSLLKNPAFKARFFTRFQELLAGPFAVDRVQARLDAMAAAIRPEVTERHVARWPAGRGYAGDIAAWDAEIARIRAFAAARHAYLTELLRDWDVVVDPVRHDGTGLRGAYSTFAGAFEALVPGAAPVDPRYRVDPAVNFAWADQNDTVLDDGAGRVIIAANLYAVWEGRVRAAWSGPTRFYATSDDGVRLFVDGVQLTPENAWSGHGMTEYRTEEVQMGAVGTYHDIRVEYFQGGGGAGVRLEWSRAMFREVIPASQLYPAP